MNVRNRIKTVMSFAVLVMVVIALTGVSTQAATTTLSAGSGNDSWNTGVWSEGVPAETINAEIVAGFRAQVYNSAPAYLGVLTLLDGASLIVNRNDSQTPQNAVENSTGIRMNEGSLISMNRNATTNLPAIVLVGNAEIQCLDDWSTTNFNGAITGTGSLTLQVKNGKALRLKVANSFSGNLIANAFDRWILYADAAGSLGSGDVTISPRSSDARSAVLVINADDAMADTATLTLNGQGWAGSNKGTFSGQLTRLQMNANDTIGGLIIDGENMEYGDYTAASGDWISGSGTLTVVPADPTLPTVDAGAGWIAWSGEPVTLSPVVVNNDTADPQGDLTIAWTAEPNGINDPNFGVVITDGDIEGATVTVSKTAPTGGATFITMVLSVTLGDKETITSSMTIDVYDDACAAAAVGTMVYDVSDFNRDCVTDLEDISMMAAAWLYDYKITAPAVQ